MDCKTCYLLCADMECKICFNKSLANYQDKNKLNCWQYYRNAKRPREIRIEMGLLKWWFKCEYGHEFELTAKQLTVNNKWCPECIQKGLYNKNTSNNIMNKEKTINTGNNITNKEETKNFTCDKCNVSFKHNFILENHYKSGLHINGKRKPRSDKKPELVCEICNNFKTISDFQLKLHMLNNHKTEEEREKEFTYYCKICKIGFFEEAGYKKHIGTSRHINKKKFTV